MKVTITANAPLSAGAMAVKKEAGNANVFAALLADKQQELLPSWARDRLFQEQPNGNKEPDWQNGGVEPGTAGQPSSAEKKPAPIESWWLAPSVVAAWAVAPISAAAGAPLLTADQQAEGITSDHGAFPFVGAMNGEETIAAQPAADEAGLERALITDGRKRGHIDAESVSPFSGKTGVFPSLLSDGDQRPFHEQGGNRPGVALANEASSVRPAGEKDVSLPKREGQGGEAAPSFTTPPALSSPSSSSVGLVGEMPASAGGSVADQVAHVLRSARWMRLPNGVMQLVIRLHPEHLGTVTVKMTEEGGKLAAKLLVANDAVKELLNAHLPQLAQQLDASSITVEKWTVWSDYDSPAMPPYSGNRQGGQQQGESRQKQKREPSSSFPFALDGIEADA
ncbi:MULTISPECIES: flagellar hook-length control protein FliK [Geobacillus]|uniref:Flagellar hook-length control protein FliK n=1 Tax=Geobacillus thermocatenulatus TaxID=33938 RepID=A0A226Q1W3_9BACL|nr:MULTISPECIES: flagellar hook-length control protein FliK [Geobacillus]ASS99939.1 flagellar hook-length control protein [Geobacillus thermocatenulatus]KLR72581.1 flagellar hook-length control protein [Geobacillus sp. T6]OXB86321.1 flagellar hook-length control protein FliK [Geobacillus thermocatenulatus]